MASRKWIPSRKRIEREYGHLDDQTRKVYLAEHYGNAVSLASFKDKKEAEHFISRVCSGPTFKRRWKKTKLTLRWSKRWEKAAYGGTIKGKPSIQLPDNPFGRSVHIILHEIAHAITNAGHGPEFCQTLLWLMTEFEGLDFSARLGKRLRETGAFR